MVSVNTLESYVEPHVTLVTYLDMQHSKLSMFSYNTEIRTNGDKQITLFTFSPQWFFRHHLWQRSLHYIGPTASS